MTFLTDHMQAFFARLRHPFAHSLQSLEDVSVKRALGKVIDERTYYGFTGHPHVKKLEEELARRFGAPVLATNSGTDALILALKVLGIGAGDEVIVPAMSFISTASCVPWVGATPVFVDIGEEDYALDFAKLEEKITPKTKAIIVAHLFGQPALGIEKIAAIAKRHDIPLIEDAAQSFGASVMIGGVWRPVGAIGDIGCLSFAPSKPLSAAGNGGAVIFNTTRALVPEADRMRFYGARKHYYDYPTVGINSKMHELQAAALLAKLPFWDRWLAYRAALAHFYTKQLAPIGRLRVPGVQPGMTRVWYRFVTRTQDRDALFAHLLRDARGIQRLLPAKYYPVLLPHFAAFRNAPTASELFPVASVLANESLALPLSNFLEWRDAAQVVACIRRFYGV